MHGPAPGHTPCTCNDKQTHPMRNWKRTWRPGGESRCCRCCLATPVGGRMARARASPSQPPLGPCRRPAGGPARCQPCPPASPDYRLGEHKLHPGQRPDPDSARPGRWGSPVGPGPGFPGERVWCRTRKSADCRTAASHSRDFFGQTQRLDRCRSRCWGCHPQDPRDGWCCRRTSPDPPRRVKDPGECSAAHDDVNR